MGKRKYVLQETAFVAISQAICLVALIGIFAILGCCDSTVLLGGIVGSIAAVLNFFFMALSAMAAADKAEAQNVAGGKATMKTSYLARTAVLFAALLAFAISGRCNMIALALPLLLVRPILYVRVFFRKPGENKA